MTKIKVLFLTYPRIGLNRGGLQLQIEKTVESLTNIDVDVRFYDPWSNQIPDVDLCHVFSIDGSLIYHAQSARNQKIPVVVSSIFSCSAVPLWQMIVKVRMASTLPGVYTDLKRAKSLLKCASHVIALTKEESGVLEASFGVNRDKITIIPNGIEKRFAFATPKIFQDKYGFNDFVLQVGSIDENKNQLATIRAMKGMPHKLVIIGQPSTINKSYYESCQSEADSNVYFLGQLTHEDPLLASAFAAAKIFILPSFNEVMPLVLYEAALAGCKLVVSNTVPIASSLKPFVTLIDPKDSSKIARAIKSELSSPQLSDAKQSALLMPTWPDTAAMIKSVYMSVL